MKTWCLVELYGHRVHVGTIEEVERFGDKFARVEALRRDGTFSVHYYGAKSIYGITERTEEEVRNAALPSNWTACSAFAEPSAREGFCATCGLSQDAHKPVPALPAPKPAPAEQGEWEPLVGSWWGIVNVESNVADPLAIFPACEVAAYELTRRQALPADDEQHLDAQHAVFRVDILGAWHNATDESTRPAPKTGDDVIELYEAAYRDEITSDTTRARRFDDIPPSDRREDYDE